MHGHARVRNRSVIGVLTLAGACAGVACGGSTAKAPGPSGRAATPVPAPATSARPAPSASVDAGPPAPRVSLEPLAVAAPESPVVVELKFPFAEQVVPSRKASRYRVRFEASGWPGPRGAGFDVGLDRFSPRRVHSPDDELVLSDLVPADAELTPGRHVIFIAAVRADGSPLPRSGAAGRGPVAIVPFHVGERGERTTPSEPRLVHLQPRGTYNGDAAADAAVLAFLAPNVSFASGARVRVRVTEPTGAVFRRELSSAEPLRLSGLASGDYHVELELASGDASASRTITVNRDAPVE